jgi:hypothetical protein
MTRADAALRMRAHFALHQVLPDNGRPAEALPAYDHCLTMSVN